VKFLFNIYQFRIIVQEYVKKEYCRISASNDVGWWGGGGLGGVILYKLVSGGLYETFFWREADILRLRPKQLCGSGRFLIGYESASSHFFYSALYRYHFILHF
jgi:hypothetical protein